MSVSLCRATTPEGPLEQTRLDAVTYDAPGPASGGVLFALLYDELHHLAERTLRRDGRALTIGATTLVHEAYLNVAGRESLPAADRARFLGYAARAMRGLVIDHARRRRAMKRGRLLEITLDEAVVSSAEAARTSDELVRLGEATAELASVAPALAELVDLHFFGGFSFAEIAELRGVSDRTVQRDWRKARMLLRHVMLEGAPSRAD